VSDTPFRPLLGTRASIVYDEASWGNSMWTDSRPSPRVKVKVKVEVKVEVEVEVEVQGTRCLTPSF
jgi:hypothetical protein